MSITKNKSRIVYTEIKPKLEPIPQKGNTKIIKAKISPSKETDENYVPVINSDTVIENKIAKKVNYTEFLKRSNYLSEFDSDGEKAEVRKNLDIKDTKYLIDPENHPYIQEETKTNVKLALDDIYVKINTPIDLSNIKYDDTHNTKEIIDELCINYDILSQDLETSELAIKDINLDIKNLQTFDDNITKAVESTNERIDNLAASEVSYSNEDVPYKNVLDALDKLFYVPIQITELSVFPSEAETGSTIETALIQWDLNKTRKYTLKLNGVVIDPIFKNQYIAYITSNSIYTLEVTDNVTTTKKSVSITFKDGKYYGVFDVIPTNDTIINDFVNNLNLRLGSEFTVNAQPNLYIYVMVPQSLKNIGFSVGGFEGGFHVANPHYLFKRYGKTFDNVLFVSDNLGLGTTKIKLL